MVATFKLFNSYFWKTIYGPILSFVIPFVLLAVLGNIMRIEYVYPGILAMSFLFIGLLSLPLAIMEFKKTALFKYIGSSPVNPMKFTFVAITYYIFISILAGIIIFLSTLILFPAKSIPNGLIKDGILGGIFSTVAGFFSFFIASGIHLIFTIVSGLLITTFSKTPQQALTIGICIIIPSMFLSGMILSVDIIAQSKALNWISRFIPYRYSTGNIVIASTPQDQIGDILTKMTVSQKSLIFKDVKENGDIYLNDGSLTSGTIIVKNMEDLINAQNTLGDDFKANNISDVKLYDLVIKQAIDTKAIAADNNIFRWTDSWSVQRIPEPDSIKLFVSEYLQSYEGGKNIGNPIIEEILKGNIGFIDVFMKQTNTLYYVADRVLNLLLPLTLMFFSCWYIVNNFKWSVR